jgi:cytidylate kinase
MAVITISHQIGSCGREIGQRVAQVLGYPYIDREIVQGVAARLGVTEDEAVAHDEKADSLISQIIASLGYNSLGGPAVLNEEIAAEVTRQSWLDNSKYQQATQNVIETMSAQGNVVIAGHGANFYLEGRKGVLSVFIYADVHKRIKTLMKRDQIDQARAAKVVHDNDNARSHYIKTLYRADWCDRQHYLLLVNTSLASPELAAGLIVKAAQAGELADKTI